jgi:endonuclease/exonuclease/phosphatase family metal-dependent hydrolase
MCPFKVLTYNIWFDRDTLAYRLPSLLSELRGAGADVMCLQEITTPTLDVICNAFADEYDVSPAPDPKVLKYQSYYFTIMLVRKRYAAEFTRVRMPTAMERNLLWADVVINTPSQPELRIRVCTVHLESKNYPLKRAEQLATACPLLMPGQSTFRNSSDQTVDVAFLCGDFNFCSYRNAGFPEPANDAERMHLENHVLQRVVPQLVDCWPSLHPDQRGYTLTSLRDDLEPAKRFDRILVSQHTQFVLSEITLIGTDQIVIPPLDVVSDESVASNASTEVSDNSFDSEDDLPEPPPYQPRRPTCLFPSDHFGLVSSFYLL